MLTAIKKSPIKTKLVLIVLFASFSVLLIENTILIARENLELKTEMTRDLGSLARVISSHCATALMKNDNKAAQEFLAALKVEHAIVAAGIYDVQGKVFARYDSGEERAFDFPAIENLPIQTQITDEHLDLSEPILSNGALIGNVFIRASLHELDFHWKYFTLLCVLMVVAMSIVALGIAIRLRRIIISPLEQLTVLAQTIVTHKDYRMRIPVENNDELGALAHAFNGLLEAVENRDHALHQSNERLVMFEQNANYPLDLLALASLEVGKGIECVGGNVEVYRKQLHRFREHFANATQELQRLLLEEHNIAAGEDYCLALKGVAGNIGANSLYNFVAHICTNLRQTKLPDNHVFQEMQLLVDSVISDIDRLAVPETPPHAPQKQDFSPALLLEKTTILLAALEEDLGSTEELILDLCAQASGSEFEEFTKAIDSEIDQFNIDNATALLIDLQQRLLAQS